MMNEHAAVFVVLMVGLGVFGIYNIYLGLRILLRERRRGRSLARIDPQSTTWLFVGTSILTVVIGVLSVLGSTVLCGAPEAYGSMDTTISEKIHKCVYDVTFGWMLVPYVVAGIGATLMHVHGHYFNRPDGRNDTGHGRRSTI